MKRVKNVMVLVTLLVLFFSSISSSASVATEREEISDMIQEHVDKAKIPNVSTGLIHGDKATFLSKGSNRPIRIRYITLGPLRKLLLHWVFYG